ncbi:MAG: hypothetical protein ABI589_06645 [Burkholderiales bacterium]
MRRLIMILIVLIAAGQSVSAQTERRSTFKPRTAAPARVLPRAPPRVRPPIARPPPRRTQPRATLPPKRVNPPVISRPLPPRAPTVLPQVATPVFTSQPRPPIRTVPRLEPHGGVVVVPVMPAGVLVQPEAGGGFAPPIVVDVGTPERADAKEPPATPNAVAEASAGEPTRDLSTTLDRTQYARFKVAAEADRATEVKSAAARLPTSSYARSADKVQHQELLTRVDSTARWLEQRAPKLPAADLALSRYYLQSAGNTAQRLNMQAGAGQSSGFPALPSARRIEPGDLQRLETATEPLVRMQSRIARGQTPFERRRVTVTVRDADGREVTEPLRVYVLPAGLIDNPSDAELIRDLLHELTFERLTSPASGAVLGGDMRVWVGPDFQYEQMAQLVMDGRVTRYAPVQGHRPGEPDPNLLFVSPASITDPARLEPVNGQ